METTIKTAYLYDFQFYDLKVKDAAGYCEKLEVCQTTGETVRAFFRILGGEFWQRYQPGAGVVFNRPILNDKKKSVYYLEEAQKARSAGKTTKEINLLLDFSETEHRREVEAEKQEKKQNGLISLKGKIWNLNNRPKKHF